MATVNFAAIDLGAESGRVMLARFDGAALTPEEAHRFPNVPVGAAGTLYWDVLRLWGDIQLTADATGRTVLAGPIEATALGNVLVQAMASGHLASLAEGRALIGTSFPVQTYTPGTTEAWKEAYQRYLRLKP